MLPLKPIWFDVDSNFSFLSFTSLFMIWQYSRTNLDLLYDYNAFLMRRLSKIKVIRRYIKNKGYHYWPCLLCERTLLWQLVSLGKWWLNRNGKSHSIASSVHLQFHLIYQCIRCLPSVYRCVCRFNYFLVIHSFCSSYRKEFEVMFDLNRCNSPLQISFLCYCFDPKPGLGCFGLEDNLQWLKVDRCSQCCNRRRYHCTCDMSQFF